ncbi:hypothetical protein Godav_003362 [Gossypium davidsonii]|nr:hypothetical protein [Gossypium davidsonii]
MGLSPGGDSLGRSLECCPLSSGLNPNNVKRRDVGIAHNNNYGNHLRLGDSIHQPKAYNPHSCKYGELSKLLLAAKRVRRATGTDFVISLVGDDFSRSSNKYVGKLRSNFLGTKFNIFDSQPSRDSTVCSSCESCRKTHPGKVAPRVTTSKYNTAKISYELNILRTRGPRRMQCIMNSIPVSAIEGGTAPTPMAFTNCLDEHSSPLLDSAGRRPQVGSTSRSMQNVPLVLKNKAPRWHEQLQCWCLNFKGRVTVASVKNFQLVAAVEPSENVTITEQENVILQFGKIGKDIFTMDYCYPLSAFQAFAICLSSFDTKPVCE